VQNDQLGFGLEDRDGLVLTRRDGKYRHVVNNSSAGPASAFIGDS
jgi:hypothetical protein